MACAGSRPQRVEVPQVNGRQSGGMHCMHCWRHVHTENGRTVPGRNCKDLIAACPSAAAQKAAHRNATLRMAESLQTVFACIPRHRESVMQPACISHGFEVGVFSSALASVRSLTQRSSGHQYLPASIGTLRAAHSGAAYLGR